MIELRKVEYFYENSFVTFDFKIEKGEELLIFGPSGSGKSTLLNLLAGFIKPNSGEILLKGKIANSLLPWQRNIAMLFQENNLFSHLSVKNNIALGISSKLKLSKEEEKKLELMAKRMQIFEKLKNFPHELSGGQRQRVALARALLQDKKILLLDEPFSALDPKLSQEMFLLIHEISQEFSLTTLMVSHKIDDKIPKKQKCLVIYEGKNIFLGSFEELLSKEELSKKLGLF